MSKIITASKLNRLWQNGILPIKQDVDNHKTETDKALTDINTALDVMEEKVDGVVENGSGSKIFCTCTGDNAIGSVLTGTLNGKTYTATVGTDGIATFIVSDCGTFVISGTEEYSVSATVVMEYFGIYRIELSSAGISSWIEAAGLNPGSYENLDELLEDEAAVRTLMTNKAAVDILANMTGDELSTIINHRYAAKWINYREYAYSTLSSVSEIKAIMDETSMYGMYITADDDGTWQPKGLVPVMTSDTAPYGEASCSSIHSSGYPAYKMFDNSNNTNWASANGVQACTVGYKFVNPTYVKRFKMQVQTASPKEFDLQVSNDGSTWNSLQSYTIDSAPTDGDVFYFDYNGSDIYYMYYRINIKSAYANDNVGLHELQFYGRQLEALIPPMTSNTTPIGEASASGVLENFQPWKAFNGTCTDSNDTFCCNTVNGWIQYKFVTPTIVNKIKLMNRNYTGGYINGSVKEFKIQGSNNGSEFVDLGTFINNNDTKLYTNYYDLNNDSAYMYYRLVGISANNDNTGFTIGQLQLYGAPDYESRTYIYDHGVEVMEVGNRGYSSGNNVIENSDNLAITKTNTSTDANANYVQGGMLETIDTTNYKVVGIIASVEMAHLMIWCKIVNNANIFTTGGYDYVAYGAINSGVNPFYLDISSVIGSNSVILGDGGNNNTGTTYVHELWLE